MTDEKVIALFLKTPDPGRVKTRLARDIGHHAACRVYTGLVENIISQVVKSGIPLAICYDGEHEDLPESWLKPAQYVLRQTSGDLGRRMAAAFQALFRGGAGYVALIGSDIPGITPDYLHGAFSMMDRHAMVIGPATDGGYCLIGFRRDCFTSAVFEGIPWSTCRVYRMTLEAAAKADLDAAALPPLSDIDSLDDLLKMTVGDGPFPHNRF